MDQHLLNSMFHVSHHVQYQVFVFHNLSFHRFRFIYLFCQLMGIQKTQQVELFLISTIKILHLARLSVSSLEKRVESFFTYLQIFYFLSHYQKNNSCFVCSICVHVVSITSNFLLDFIRYNLKKFFICFSCLNKRLIQHMKCKISIPSRKKNSIFALFSLILFFLSSSLLLDCVITYQILCFALFTTLSNG